MRAIDMFPGVFYIVGLLCMMLNNRNKRLGDFIAGTVLVHDKRIETVSPIWNPGDLSSLANLQTSGITAAELLLIETYLNRRGELNSTVRKENARKIVSMVEVKTGVERLEGQSDDAFLEAVARKVRDNARYR
jgi:hypothetical protein